MTSENPTTPGPWSIFNTGSINQIVPAMREGMVADLIQNDADAYLIAAAPDMAKALADLMETLSARPDIMRLCGQHERIQIERACYALNKARWPL